MSDILSSVSSLLQIILIVLAVAIGFYLARRWRIRRLRAARAAFDWASPEPVLEKIREELDECAAELARGAAPAAVEEEIGDLLFSCVNLARHLRVDAETALRRANGKFERRFHTMERLQEERGGSVQELEPEALERLWNRAKAVEVDDPGAP